MKPLFFRSLVSLALPLLTVSLSTLRGHTSQLVSAIDAGQDSPAGGSGDSWAPVVSLDGRYVLFTSTANNLLLTSNNTAIPAHFPAVLNVYLRDRTERTTALVSVNTSGIAGGNGDSVPVAISTNGRYALFESSASDLVAGDTNKAPDVFVRDLVANSTILVSVSTNGGVGNGESRSAVMTPDGRYVAFVSRANDLVAKDTNGIPDVFVRDMEAGVTVLASLGALSTNATIAVGSSEAPEITPDGRYLAFFSTATNLVPGVPPGGDVYVRDLIGGTTTWASAGARTATLAAFKTSSAASYNYALSDDGQFVAYESSTGSTLAGPIYPGLILRYNQASGLTDLVSSNAAVVTASYQDIHTLDMTPDGRFIAFVANTNGPTTTCIQLWDGASGTVSLVSGDRAGQVTTNTGCYLPSIDPSGRFVTFVSSAPNLTTNGLAGTYHVYVRDMQAGLVLVDADTNGVGAGVSLATVPATTPDARFVAFDCPDSSLVPHDRNHDSDVFLRDLAAGTTEMISVHDPALSTITANGASGQTPVSISADGRYVAFSSDADNLTSHDTNGLRDVFVRDLARGVTTLVSVNTNGFSGDGLSTDPAISSDGRYVAFTSVADNLVAGDTNGVPDVFVRDLQSGTTTLVSVNSAGTGPGNRSSYLPRLGTGGRFVLFRSLAANLAPITYARENLFIRDMQTGVTTALTTSGLTNQPVPVMTPDGGFVAYAVGALPATLYVWDSAAAGWIYTNTCFAVGGLALSAGGSRMAFSSVTSSGVLNTNSLFITDLASNTTQLVEANSLKAYYDLSLNADASKLACLEGTPLNSTNQVFLFDLRMGGSSLVSHAFLSSAAGNGSSYAPELSADGRFVAYRSAASDLVGGDTNGVPDLFLYDAQSGANTLVSEDSAGGFSANNRSLNPVFSGDGRMLCFQSWASDLTVRDFNNSSDIFACALFYAVLTPAISQGQPPWISWPWVPGKNYRVQYKDSLGDTVWHELDGVTNSGNQGLLLDTTPAGGQRFYRVIAF